MMNMDEIPTFPTFLADPRRVYGLMALLGLGGFLLGYRLAAGAESFPQSGQVITPETFAGVPPEPQRCVECEEAKLQRELDALRARTASNIAKASQELTIEQIGKLDPPAPLIDLEPPPEPFDHTKVSPSAATFSPLVSPGPEVTSA